MPLSVVPNLHDGERSEGTPVTVNMFRLRYVRSGANIMKLRLARLLVCNLHGGTLYLMRSESDNVKTGAETKEYYTIFADLAGAATLCKTDRQGMRCDRSWSAFERAKWWG